MKTVGHARTHTHTHTHIQDTDTRVVCLEEKACNYVSGN